MGMGSTVIVFLNNMNYNMVINEVEKVSTVVL